MKETNNSRIPIYDIHLSAYLDMNGIHPELVKEGSRVLFAFPNEDSTFKIMAKYNGNPEVHVTDYVHCLRKLRSQMLDLRDLRLAN